MLSVVVGLEGEMEWPQWAENFIAAYMKWSDIKSKDDIEFCNMGKFIKEKIIPLAEFKEITTTTHTAEGLKSSTSHFIFAWETSADKASFISRFEHD